MRLAAVACVLAWLLLPTTGAASPRLAVQASFDAWREGDLVPLRVRIENDGPAALFQLSASSVDSPFGPRVEESLELESGARKSFWIALQPASESIRVVLSRDGVELEQRVLQLVDAPWSLALVGTLGPPPSGLARQLEAGGGGRPVARLTESSPDQVPEEVLLWPSLDQLFWPAPLSHELSERQAAALKAWVGDGGRLIAGTHAEDPQALATLGLLPAPLREGEHALGWGRVALVGTDLSRATAATWFELLELRAEPPSARVSGPNSLTLGAQSKVDGAVAPPFAAALLVLSGALVALVLTPWLLWRRAARGETLGRRRVPLSLAVIALAPLASLSIAHFGGGRGLVVDRLDLVDVDAGSGLVRARTVIALRRARSGSLEVDTRGAGRLRALAEPALPHDAPPAAAHALSADAASSTADVRSWESLRFDARWRPDALTLPDLQASASELAQRLGALRAATTQRSSVEWITQDEAEPATDLMFGLSLLLNFNTPIGPAAENPTRSLEKLMEFWLLNTTAGEQWRWPASERWLAHEGEELLVALAPGSAAPALWIDGREASGQSFTLWRVRLAGGQGDRS